MVYNDTQFQFLYEVLKEQALAILNPDTAPSNPSSDNSFEPTIKAELKPIDDIISTAPAKLVSSTLGLRQ